MSEQKTFAVLCTGPSIKDWNECNEDVIIGCNEIVEYDFTINYYCALDHNSIKRWGNDTNVPILTQPSRKETVNGEAEYLPNNRDIHNELGFEADCAYRTITTLSALAWAVLKDADVINIYGMDLQYKSKHDNQYEWRRDWDKGVFHDERQWFTNFKIKAENNGISVNRKFKDSRQEDVWAY